MTKHLLWAASALILISSAPAAAQECDECPRVQLLRAADQIRIAAEDDEDAYEDLQHRVRLVTASGATGWTPWADTNAYGLKQTVSGRLEAETIDLQGNVGRGVIQIVAPQPTAEGSRGPATVEEDSSVEAYWSEGVGSDGSAASDVLPEDRSDPEDWLEAQQWDHSVCPVSSADDSDAACSTTNAASRGTLGAMLLLLALGIVRFRRN